MTDIDLQPFQDAVARLEGSLAAGFANPLDAYVRDTVIMRFTVTFEVSVSTLDGYLNVVAGLLGEHRLSPRHRIREAAETWA